MRRIGLLSDTHSYLPESVFTHFDEVDEIWHAGDIGNTQTADTLEAFKPLRAVYGNIDGHDLRVRYPEHSFFRIEETTILMLHIGGYPPKYNRESLALIQQYKPHVFICGHSHILKVIPDPTYNLLHLNPGACGQHGWHKVSTLLRFTINKDRIQELEIIELGKRGI